MHRKAQTATEYLIILAVVIIIALIVVGVMGGIPGIGTGAGSRASAAYWRTADLAITSYSVDSDVDANNLLVNVRNNLVTTITITQIDFTSVGATDSYLTDETYTPGQTRAVPLVLTNTDPCAAEGDSFSLDITFSYTDQATGESYTFSGEGNKLQGKCAT